MEIHPNHQYIQTKRNEADEAKDIFLWNSSSFSLVKKCIMGYVLGIGSILGFVFYTKWNRILGLGPCNKSYNGHPFEKLEKIPRRCHMRHHIRNSK